MSCNRVFFCNALNVYYIPVNILSNGTLLFGSARNLHVHIINDANGIGNLLGGLLGGGAQKEQSLVTQILDADGDGSVIDDLIGMAAGGSQKKGGLGGLLGGLFGGK